MIHRNLLSTVPALPYRLTGFLFLLVTGVICYLLVFFGPRIHEGYGTATDEEYDSATLGLLVDFLVPVFGLYPAFATVRGFDKLKEERIYKLQGLLSAGLVVIICLVTLWSVYDVIVNADYEIQRAATGILEEDYKPCHMTLGSRIQKVCTFVGAALFVALGIGLFAPDSNDLEDTAASESSVS